MQSRSNNNLKGIDISNWKGNVDFSKVKNAGIEIVYAKATEANYYKDKYAKRNYEGAKANGLKVGFYHFFRANKDAKEQARFFIGYLNEIGATNYDCKLALDIETTEGKGKSELTSMCIEFLEEVKRLTRKDVVVYTYTSFANNNLDTRLSNYPVWIAHYGINTPGNNPIWSSWIGFQYSNKGSVSGVSGDCDMNEFTEEILLNRSTAQLNVNSGKQSFINSTNAKARVALDPRDNPSNDYTDLGEIYADERIQVLAEVCDRDDYLPIKYWKDELNHESGKVWVNASQKYLEIDTNAKSFNIRTELDARYNPSSTSQRMGYVKNNERLYVHKIENGYALATYFAGDGYKTAWFTNKYILRD
ncbi:GH25 family lysozyme [Clostridium sp.]|uniref:GH25 family lysozyme n=1 Tax=Clostridium sp. TaxID=1506 RepID=UPI002620D729|nr:GH25 family lysozyme [Clostridium sp.]